MTFNWNDPVGRVDSYNIRVSIGTNPLQQYYFHGITMLSLKLDWIPYNENITVGISSVNCIDESEEVSDSFVISKHFHNVTLSIGA